MFMEVVPVNSWKYVITHITVPYSFVFVAPNTLKFEFIVFFRRHTHLAFTAWFNEWYGRDYIRALITEEEYSIRPKTVVDTLDRLKNHLT